MGLSFGCWTSFGAKGSRKCRLPSRRRRPKRSDFELSADDLIQRRSDMNLALYEDFAQVGLARFHSRMPKAVYFDDLTYTHAEN